MEKEIEILKRRKQLLERSLDEWDHEYDAWPNREAEEMRRAVKTVLGMVSQHIEILNRGGKIR